jgi:hypothetical protein
MSSLRLALKQSLQEAGHLAPGEGGEKKKRRKKKSMMILQRGTRPGEQPPKTKRKRGRPRKHPRVEDSSRMKEQGSSGEMTSAAAGEREVEDDDHGDSSSENEFSYDEEDEEEDSDSHDDDDEESGEEDDEEEEEGDDDMGSKATSNLAFAHATFRDSQNQQPSNDVASGEANADESTALDEMNKQHNMMKKKLKNSAANTIQSQWKKKRNPSDASAYKSTEGGALDFVRTSEMTENKHSSPSRTHVGKDASDEDAAVVKKKKKKRGVVPPPTLEILQWAQSMSEKKCRKYIVSGLRVKVRFATTKKRDGKVIKKKIWYGGKVTAVSKKGSKIKIKYDDGTSEITKFPDNDVVVDDAMNGKHEAPADRFLPSDGPQIDQGDSEDQLETEAKIETNPASEESSSKQHMGDNSMAEKDHSATVDAKALEADSLEDHEPDTGNETSNKAPPMTPVNASTADTTTAAIPEASKPRGAPLMASPEEGELSPGITANRREVTDVVPLESMPSPQAEETGMSLDSPSEADEGTAKQLSPISKPSEAESSDATLNAKINAPGGVHATESASVHATESTSSMATPVTEKEVKSIDDILVDTPVAQDELKRKRDDDDLEVEEPPTRKAKVLHETAEVVLPVPSEKKQAESSPKEASLSAAADENATAASEEPKRPSITSRLMDLAPPQQAEKKKKKKDRAKSPRPRSPKPKPIIADVGTDGHVVDDGADAGTGKKAGKSHLADEVESTIAEVDSKEFSLKSQPSTDSLGSASRGGRKAAQQAKEKLNTKEKETSASLEVGKKKKKKRKLEEADTDADEVVEDLTKEFQWVQCDACTKWRAIPGHIKESSLPKLWYCRLNTYDPKRMTCDAPEQTPKQVMKELKRAKKRAKRLELEAQQAAESKKEKQAVDAAAVSPKPTKGVKSVGKVKDLDDMKKKATSSVSEEKHPPSDTGSDALKEEKKKGKKGKHEDNVEAPEVTEPGPEPKKPGRKRGRPARNQTAPQPASRDSQDEDNVEWVQCENPKCQKWRKLPPDISADELPDTWYCSMNTWNPLVASCDAPEDKTDALHHEVGSSEWQLRQTHAGKYSYRQMIFGTGARKQNRPMSERSRAAESLFVKPVSDDDENPIPTTQYSKCSSFLPRTSNFHKAHIPDEKSIGIFDVLSNSTLWAELRAMEQAQPIKINSNANAVSSYPKFVTYEYLPNEIKIGIQEVILQILGNKALSGDSVIHEAQQYPWEDEGMIAYANADVMINTLLALVRDGIVEMTTTRDRHIPISQWIPLYRRVKSKRALEAEEQIKSSKCMKIAKPWKQRADAGAEWTTGREAFS